MVLILSRSELERLLSMKETIEAVEKSFLELAHGQVTMPQRIVIQPANRSGRVLYMPSYVGGSVEALAVKVVSVYHENLAKGLPGISATVQLNDPETGQTLAIMDGTYITALRTGATTAVATKYLSRETSETVAVIGSGVQAETQLEGICAVRNIKRAYVYSRSRENRSKFCTNMSRELGVGSEPADSAETAVSKADIIVTATTSPAPVIRGDWIKTGSHVNAIGAFTPTTAELDDVTISRGKIFVDYKPAALAEAGELIIPIRKGLLKEEDVVDLPQLVGGTVQGRTSEDEITVFKSVGLAIEDAATAKLAYDKALKTGLGTEINLN